MYVTERASQQPFDIKNKSDSMISGETKLILGHV